MPTQPVQELLVVGARSIVPQRPTDPTKFNAVVAEYTDGERKRLFYSNELAAIDFVITANWLKERVGSPARLRFLEFDR